MSQTIEPDALEAAIARACDALVAEQRPDGHFVFDLEADVTIPAEYVLFTQFLGEPGDHELEAKIAVYLRRTQGAHGGWPLFHEGAFNISASVKAYYALKMIGDAPDAPHMARARAAILAHGGAAQSNVFTRGLLALYGAIPWRGVPVMPVEIMHLPRWFPFHLTKISYWARTVLVPLMVLTALKPLAKNPRGVRIDEVFVQPPDAVRRWPKGPHQVAPWTQIFSVIDHALRAAEPFMPRGLRASAIDKAVAFVRERLNGEDGLGAIFPAMINSVMMFDAVGLSAHPDRATARASVEKLVTICGQEAYVQPCLSPVWDTALAALALIEAGEDARAQAALDWLRPLQVLDVKGDWAQSRPHVRPGGWAFQYANPHYPDLDDTAVVVMGMDRITQRAPAAARPDYGQAMARGAEWILGLQSRNGGFGAFDADNDHEYLNNIPFSDHGALLDPPTADVTARCISMLAQLGPTPEGAAAIARALAYLRRTQEKDGSWFGRWGMNYIYGAWSVLCALNAAGVPHDAPETRRAVAWLLAIQNADGGWGEDGESYAMDHHGHEPAPSTPSQTAWALLGLMAAGELDHPAVTRGVSYLKSTQGVDGAWREARFNATGFPRVFYLRYHGYAKFFPLWALARFRNLKHGDTLSAGM